MLTSYYICKSWLNWILISISNLSNSAAWFLLNLHTTMHTRPTSPISVERASPVRERDVSASCGRMGLVAKQLQQDLHIDPSIIRSAWILEKTSKTKHRRPPSSDATHNTSNKDFNASPSIPPIIHHLSLYVNHSKARFKPYKRNGPSLWALCFAESSLTPTESDLSLVDVQNVC